MLTLCDLLNTASARNDLAAKGIFVSQAEFLAQLLPPTNLALAHYMDAAPQHLVWAGQQVYVDCTQSMCDRIALLQQLGQADNVLAFFLWLDTDRAGSDPLITKFFWLVQGKKKAVRICPKAVADHEQRFVEIDHAYVQQAIDTLGMYLTQSIPKHERARPLARYEQLRTLFVQEQLGTLSEFNQRVADFLLIQQTGYSPTPLILSNLLEAGVLATEIDLVLDLLADIIQVFNASIESLAARGIDPLMQPLRADYLPLYYSCPVDGRRLRLRLETNGDDRFAVTTCKCGEHYRFHLGSRHLSVTELARTARWSPDILLALFMNDLVSGYVGGSSSAIYYGLVMQDVIEKVLGKRRVPLLVPEPAGAGPAAKELDSLMYQYIHA